MPAFCAFGQHAWTDTPSVNLKNYGNKVWFDLDAAQSFGLQKWSDNRFVNDAMNKASSTDLRETFNWRWARGFGFFQDLSLSIHPGTDGVGEDLSGVMPDRLNGQYHFKEFSAQNMGDHAGLYVKMTFGFFGQFKVNDRWQVMPYAGIGFMTINSPRLSAVIKEQGTNTYYNVTASWFGDYYDEFAPDFATLGYLSGRLKFVHPIGKRTNLIFGIEYTWVFDEVDFQSTFTHMYNDRIVRTYSLKGNEMSWVGLSAGISFR